MLLGMYVFIPRAILEPPLLTFTVSEPEGRARSVTARNIVPVSPPNPPSCTTSPAPVAGGHDPFHAHIDILGSLACKDSLIPRLLQRMQATPAVHILIVAST